MTQTDAMVVRVGFVGCGLIARSHANKLRGSVEADHARIVSVFDVDPERTESFAGAHDAHEATSAEQVIDAVDAVYVTTWTSAHAEVVHMAAAAGRAIFCEKPLAVDLAIAAEMTHAVRAAGVVNQVGLVLRHSPSFRWLQHNVASAEHGAAMSMMFRDDQYIPVQGMYGSTWRRERALAGAGTLLEHSIHDLDLIEWILGPIVRISCSTHNSHGIEGIEDQASVMLRARSGAIACLSSTWHDVLTRPSQRMVEMFCREAHVALHGDWDGPIFQQTSEGEGTIEQGSATIDAAAKLDGLGANPDASFINAVRTEKAAYPDFAIALRAHELADAAYRSASADGIPIDV